MLVEARVAVVEGDDDRFVGKRCASIGSMVEPLVEADGAVAPSNEGVHLFGKGGRSLRSSREF